METPRHDLPTLHRPVTYEENTRIDRYQDLTKELRPRPTPPHKAFRPHTSMSFSYNQYKSDGLSTVPSMLTDTNWRTRRAKQTKEELPEESDFTQSYEDLVARKAYRHPHPGVPKGREGCVGGTWRHTKEAVGYGPGRLMWIDGIVTLYDDWTLNNEKPWSGRRSTQDVASNSDGEPNRHTHHRRYIPTQNRIPTIDNSSRWYSCNQPQPIPSAHGPPSKSAALDKYKGFYSMAQVYT